MKTELRILLIGEDGTGKSTLISSLIKETFVSNVQLIVPEVTIPPEVTPENITTHLIDSSSQSEFKGHLDHEIRKADVICVVYSTVDRNTFMRIPEYWLPHLRSLNVQVPVILIGTKTDLKTNSTSFVDIEEDVASLMQIYREIETCLECSSKHFQNVTEILYFCQKAVLYPSSPLFDHITKNFKPECFRALERIFTLSDMDKDGFLSDAELNDFQLKCFGSTLQTEEISALKSVIAEQEPSGVASKGLTPIGFIYLHGLFIQRGRMETTWSVLRRFGYDDKLNLRESFVHPSMDIPPDCTVELSPHGYQFFTELFQAHDKDNDGALSESELSNLFSPSPATNPWAQTEFPNTTVTNQAGAVTLQGFLAQWSLTTLQDPQTTLANLAYLGYDGDTRNALKLARPKYSLPNRSRVQRRSPQNGQQRDTTIYPRSVFSCYVLGGAGCGKTSILRAFARKQFQDTYVPTTRPFSVVNAVDIHGSEKYLVLEELGANYEAAVLQSKRKLEQCDLLCLVYDASDPNSFLHVMHLRDQYELDHLPYVIVATKCDLEPVRQRTDDQPEAYCKQLGIAQPIRVSVKQGDLDRLFNLFASVAMNPTGSIPGLNDSRRQGGSGIYKYLAATLIAGAVLTTGYLLYRTFRPSFSHLFQHSRSAPR